MAEVTDLFLELASISSPPGEERPVADVVLRYLRGLGLDPDEDASGNVYARIEPAAEGTPLFFCAHMDTVPPDGPLEPVVADGMIRNAGGTILGADNKSAVATMLDAARRVLAENRPHAGVELLFTTQEEVGLVGAAAFDHARLHAKLGYVYDQAGPIGEIILGAPWARRMDVTFHGRASHSGMFPEEGRSAIQAAAKAIADLRLGRIDEETTANVGVISGGTAVNIIPEWCTFLAEVRSHDERKMNDVAQEMLDAFTFAATESECEVDTKLRNQYRGYRLAKSDDVVRLAATAFERCGRTVSYALSGGAADANSFNERGLRCANLSNGVADIHTPDERISIDDLEGMVEATLAIIDAARAA